MNKIFHDEEHGHTGYIDEVYIYPYKGAACKKKSYRVTIEADFDDSFIYHVSVFETFEAAVNDLRNCAFDI